MHLSDLLSYDNITIQCHDNPDADALASGFALYLYFKGKKIKTRFIYGGRSVVQKSNLLLMITELRIPAEYVAEAGKKFDGLLITVDCCYGEGNVTHFEADKGYRKTSIKTVYGEVEYRRSVYEVTREDGTHEYVFLLDEQLHIKGVGLISQNLAEQLVSGITEMSYRNCAEKISGTTGQSVSAMGVWNVIQGLGEAVCEDERQLVRDHKAGRLQGGKTAPVLFEEADGIYVNLQRERQSKGEIKVGIAYDGWKKAEKDRYALDGKVVVAGFSNSREFHDYREAAIAETYDTDEITLRIMNADGAEWIKNVHEAGTLFQLDPFHRNKAIKECIPYPEAIREVHAYLKKRT